MAKNPEQIHVSSKTEKEAISISVAELGDAAAAQRVYEVFRKAEALANPEEGALFSGTDIHEDMAAYGERSGIPQENIENVAQEIGVEESLAKLNREEAIARNRFKDRLRRFAAQAAACISLMSPNMSRADEYVQEPATYSQPAEPMVAKASGADRVTHAESGAVQTETEKPDTRIPQTIEMSDEEWAQYVAREEQYQTRLAFENEFRERSFANEKELLQSLHDAALNHENEFIALYTISGGDRVEVVLGEFDGKDGVVIADTAKQLRALRQEGKKVVMAHTHPSAFSERASAELLMDGAFKMLPPSLPDIRTASDMDWLDRYDDAGNRSDVDRMANASESVVVDHDGVWRYKVDFFHPYLQEQREAAVDDAAVRHMFTETDGNDFGKVKEFYSRVVVPDEIVLNRIVPAAGKSLREDLSSATLAKTVGVVSPIVSDYEYTSEQMRVGTAIGPGEKAAATKAFIGYCKERGIDISFTPFENGGK
jgi:hypothetical protein